MYTRTENNHRYLENHRAEDSEYLEMKALVLEQVKNGVRYNDQIIERITPVARLQLVHFDITDLAAIVFYARQDLRDEGIESNDIFTHIKKG